MLGGLAELVPLQTKKPEEFLAQAADCDALLNTYAGPITADVMAKMPKCRIIARYGIGVDTIDLDAATAAGIIVTNNPTYCIEEVAEHTMALLLACARKVAFYDRLVRAGRWEVPPGKPLFRLAGSTLGLVGFGNIARQVAVRAAAFGMKRALHRPVREAGPVRRARARAVELERRCWRVGLRVGASAAHAADAQDDQRRGVRADEADRIAHQLLARPDHRHRRAGARARREEDRRLRARHDRSRSRCPIRIRCATATTSSSIRTSPGTARRR